MCVLKSECIHVSSTVVPVSELCQSESKLTVWFGQNMREDLKEAPVYLSVMSADPHVPINKSNPSNNDNKTTHDLPSHQGRDGGNTAERKKSTTATPIATTTSRSSSSNNNIEHEDSTHPVETPHQPDSNSLLVHSVMSANTTESGSENTKSAFEIISVSAFDAADDMEQTKGMSHEADSFMEAAKHRGQSESSESDEILRTSLSGGGGGGVSKHAGNILVNKEQLSETNERVLPLEMATNGPVVQPVPRRFRRVNKYERGRWVIEDALEHRETEERPESEMRGVYSTQGASSRSSAGPVGLGRESPFSQRRKPGEGGAGGGAGGEDLSQLHSRSSSDVGGQGLDSPNTGERENIERGDVTSNLSRNTSVSSLTTAGDKSVDGDHSSDRFSQLKDESETDITYPQPYPQQSHTYTTGNSTQATPPQQQLGHSEATITTTMAAITTNTITSSVGMDMTQ